MDLDNLQDFLTGYYRGFNDFYSALSYKLADKKPCNYEYDKEENVKLEMDIPKSKAEIIEKLVEKGLKE